MTQETTVLERREGETDTEWLKRRLCDDEGRALVNFHVSWGPRAASMSPEERAAVVNRVIDQVAAGDFEEDPGHD